VRALWIFAVWVSAFFVIATGICGSLVARSVRRVNRVSPHRRSAAPVAWLYSWREPARLHRRLRRAVAVAHSAVAPLRPPQRRWRRADQGGALAEMADELGRRAAAVDDQLVWAASLHPGWRRQTLASLAREAAEIESNAWRLAHLANRWRAQLDQAALSQAAPPLDLGARLDAFEAAMAELARVSSAR
jgi:hypothetical protein